MARVCRLVAIAALVLAALAALAALLLWNMDRVNPTGPSPALIGKKAPPLPATVLAGKPGLTDPMLRQPGLKLVNFWASWCPPCRAEHATLTTLSKQLPIYGVDLKDSPADAAAFLDRYGDPFRAIAADPAGRAALDWGVTGPPQTFIIDGKGTVLFRFAGPLLREDYTNRFLPELEKARQAAN